MQFALVDGQKREATPGLTGHCPGCGLSVIAKCGDQRIWHWAHLGKRTCNAWWEPETPWHRARKGWFAAEWREVISLDDRTGERHIADVRTALGLVLEFQHSRLDPAERAAREAFYRNMVWLVDGTRLKRDWPRFAGGRRTLRRTAVTNVFITPFPEECFPTDWLHCSKPVFFDFAGMAEEAGLEQDRRVLWCLLPGRVDGYAVIVAISWAAFISAAMTKPQIVNVRARLNDVAVELHFLRDMERQRVMAEARQRSYSQYKPRKPRKRGKAARWRF